MSVLGPSLAVRPRLLVSRCLDLEACRYDGQVIAEPLVRALERHVELVPVCPEVSIGLGVPRDPIRIVAGRDGSSGHDGAALVQPSTARDLTPDMLAFRASFLDRAERLDGAILKARSPSCGIAGVKVFASSADAEPAAFGRGFFAEAVIERLGETSVADEVALADPAARDRFLTRLFTFARLRAARDDGTAAALGRFHAEHKLLLMAHDEPALRELGPQVASAGRQPLGDVWDRYVARFRVALARPPEPGSVANAWMHALGYFRDAIPDDERRAVSEALASAGRDDAALTRGRGAIRSWTARERTHYLSTQALFWPYPEELRTGLGL